MNKNREIAIQERLRAVYEARLYRSLNRLLKSYAILLQRGYSKGKEPGIEIALDGFEDKIYKLLASYYYNVGALFGNRVLEMYEGKSIDVKSTRSLFDEQLDVWLKHNAAKKAKLIEQNMRGTAAKILQRSAAEGLGEVATAKLLGSKFKDLSPFQAARIARTEVHAASNAASLMAANATPARPKKEWLTVEDERTRESHSLANGQIVEVDEPFNIGGASLMYPGDPEGPAEEVINCRCVIGWSF
jgi:hypothetical protein